MSKGPFLVSPVVLLFTGGVFFTGCHGGPTTTTAGNPPDQGVAVDAMTTAPPEATQENRVHVVEIERGNAHEIADTLLRFAAARGRPTAVLSGEVAVIPYRSTNALVIVSTQEDFRQLRELIDALDAPPTGSERVSAAPENGEM